MKNNIMPISIFCKKYEWPKKRTIQWYYTHRERFGMTECLFKKGKYILIDEEEFFRCIRENQKVKNE